MTSNLYEAYKAARRRHPYTGARQAHIIARTSITNKVRRELLGADHPLNVDLPNPGETVTVTIADHACLLTIDYDDLCHGDDEWHGFAIERNRYEFYAAGWGRDGMDNGEYIADSDTRVRFTETRQEVISWAPKGMSKQVAYEWATRIMRSKKDHYDNVAGGGYYEVYIKLSCEELGEVESLGGIGVDDNAPLTEADGYLREVYEELYGQLKPQIDEHKKAA